MLNTLNSRNPAGYTYINSAILFKNIPVVNSLVKLGADVNIVNRYGITPLANALSNSYPEEIIDKILEKQTQGYSYTMKDINFLSKRL